MTFEDLILARLAELDALHERLQPDLAGTDFRPPVPAWLKSAQQRNPFYNEILGADALVV